MSHSNHSKCEGEGKREEAAALSYDASRARAHLPDARGRRVRVPSRHGDRADPGLAIGLGTAVGRIVHGDENLERMGASAKAGVRARDGVRQLDLPTVVASAVVGGEDAIEIDLCSPVDCTKAEEEALASGGRRDGGVEAVVGILHKAL